MPIHQYQCLKCNHLFDRITLSIKQAQEEKDSLPCERCGFNTHRIASVTGKPVINGFSEKNLYGIKKELDKPME